MSEVAEKYSDGEFSYQITKGIRDNNPEYRVRILIQKFPVFYQGQSNPKERGFRSFKTACMFVKNILKNKCSGNQAERSMKRLPIFKDGYQESIKF